LINIKLNIIVHFDVLETIGSFACFTVTCLMLYTEQWSDLESGSIDAVFPYSYNFEHLTEFNINNISFPIILLFVKCILWKERILYLDFPFSLSHFVFRQLKRVDIFHKTY